MPKIQKDLEKATVNLIKNGITVENLIKFGNAYVHFIDGKSLYDLTHHDIPKIIQKHLIK